MNTDEPSLRPYPVNSPHAAARIVALALIANGRIKAVETATLDALDAPGLLRLTRPQWHDVIRDLSGDLLELTGHDDECCISAGLLDRVLDEVEDVAQRRIVLRLCSAVVQADCQIDDGESFVLLAAVERWGFHPDEQALLEPLLYGSDFQVRPRGALAESGHRLRLL